MTKYLFMFAKNCIRWKYESEYSVKKTERGGGYLLLFHCCSESSILLVIAFKLKWEETHHAIFCAVSRFTCTDFRPNDRTGRKEAPVGGHPTWAILFSKTLIILLCFICSTSKATSLLSNASFLSWNLSFCCSIFTIWFCRACICPCSFEESESFSSSIFIRFCAFT